MFGFNFFLTKMAFMANQFYRHPTHFVKMGHTYLVMSTCINLIGGTIVVIYFYAKIKPSPADTLCFEPWSHTCPTPHLFTLLQYHMPLPVSTTSDHFTLSHIFISLPLSTPFPLPLYLPPLHRPLSTASYPFTFNRNLLHLSITLPLPLFTALSP